MALLWGGQWGRRDHARDLRRRDCERRCPARRADFPGAAVRGVRLEKLTGFAGTVAYFAHGGVPLPFLAAIIAVVAEFFGGLAIAIGLFTRPVALLLALYTLGTAILGHHFWNMSGAARMENEINFLKNIGLIGGFLLLYLTGAGRYSVDDKINVF